MADIAKLSEQQENCQAVGSIFILYLKYAFFHWADPMVDAVSLLYWDGSWLRWNISSFQWSGNYEVDSSDPAVRCYPVASALMNVSFVL